MRNDLVILLKTLAIARINGGKHSSATLKALANELKPAIE
jgi:hypothetical protein